MRHIENVHYEGSAGPFPVLVTVSVVHEDCMYCGSDHPNWEMFDVWKQYHIGRFNLFKRRLGMACQDCAVKRFPDGV